MDPFTISLLAYSLISTGLNIWFGVENSNLRKKIEYLEEIIIKLDKELKSTQKELEALKKWHFIKIRNLKRDIKILNEDIKTIIQVMNSDEQNIDAFIRQLNYN